jgi:small subunit ribosomal protein S21
MAIGVLGCAVHHFGRSDGADKPSHAKARCATSPDPEFSASDWRESERHVQVIVRDNNVDQALKALKKKMQREGIFREMKLRRSYEKPSERRAREKAEAVRRARKLERKRLEREGF